MEAMQWIWIGIALLCMIAQFFVAGQSLLIAGVGAMLAALMALGGVSLPWQLIAFVVIAGLGLLRTPRAAPSASAAQETVFGVERLVGEEGIVVVTIDPERLTGRVLVDHETWPAYSDTGEVILDGSQVFILAVQNDRLRVRPIPNENLPRR
jgi:membrane protein implicated in regulation of membrane protease activity